MIHCIDAPNLVDQRRPAFGVGVDAEHRDAQGKIVQVYGQSRAHGGASSL